MLKLPIGQSDFASLRREAYHFVDKSLLIRDVIDSALVCLITRPRRFGKSLNLSMLRYFYTNEAAYTDCFDGLAILKVGDRYLEKMGKHPVLFLSLKDVRQSNWEEAVQSIHFALLSALKPHLYLLEWDQIRPEEKRLFAQINEGNTPIASLKWFLALATAALSRYHQKRVVILIDEYDAPVVAAYLGGYYDQMIDFLKDFLSTGLKDNVNLEKGVLTGIMRIAKESIFSGLNNLNVFSLLTHKLSSHFGFTTQEVKDLLTQSSLNDANFTQIHDWYNGYLIGQETIFNPWSILQFIDKPEDGLHPYWAETSTNSLLKQLFFEQENNIEAELEELIRGQSLRKPIQDSLIYPELQYKKDAIWSLLLSAGYLKAENYQLEGPDGLIRSYALSIPNKEVKGIYLEKIRNWIHELASDRQIEKLLKAIRRADSYAFEEALAHFALVLFSYHDTQDPDPERFYHAFILGLLANLGGEYEIQSNREAGYGRFDIRLKPQSDSRAAILIELKSPRKRAGENLQHALDMAIQQIKTKKYEADWEAKGITKIEKWAIAVSGKDVMVKAIS